MKLQNYFLILLVGSVLFLSSCGDGELDPLEPSADQTFGIRHDKSLRDYESAGANQGSYSTSVAPDFSSVITFSYSLNGSSTADYVASGTLIAPDWILTAGHNFYVAEEQNSPAPIEGINVLVGLDPNNPSSTIEVSELAFHPTWVSQGDGFVKGNDLCLVKLKTPITNITPAPLFDNSGENLETIAWFCGYGDYSQTSGEDADLLSKKHAMQNILDRKVAGIETSENGTTYSGGLLAYDFDNPEETINSLGDDLNNADEQALGGGTSSSECLDLEGATITGDSGGPLFVKDGDTWKVAGVLSGGAVDPVANHKDSNYGDISIFTRVSSSIAWIQSVIQ